MPFAALTNWSFRLSQNRNQLIASN